MLLEPKGCDCSLKSPLGSLIMMVIECVCVKL